MIIVRGPKGGRGAARLAYLGELVNGALTACVCVNCVHSFVCLPPPPPLPTPKIFWWWWWVGVMMHRVRATR